MTGMLPGGAGIPPAQQIEMMQRQREAVLNQLRAMDVGTPIMFTLTPQPQSKIVLPEQSLAARGDIQALNQPEQVMGFFTGLVERETSRYPVIAIREIQPPPDGRFQEADIKLASSAQRYIELETVMAMGEVVTEEQAQWRHIIQVLGTVVDGDNDVFDVMVKHLAAQVDEDGKLSLSPRSVIVAVLNMAVKHCEDEEKGSSLVAQFGQPLGVDVPTPSVAEPVDIVERPDVEIKDVPGGEDAEA